MKIFRKFLPYLIALVIGVVVMLIITPYAESQRLPMDPVAARVPGAGTGGEVLIPFIAVGGVFFVRSVLKDIKDGIFAQLSDDSEEEDDQ